MHLLEGAYDQSTSITSRPFLPNRNPEMYFVPQRSSMYDLLDGITASLAHGLMMAADKGSYVDLD